MSAPVLLRGGRVLDPSQNMDATGDGLVVVGRGASIVGEITNCSQVEIAGALLRRDRDKVGRRTRVDHDGMFDAEPGGKGFLKSAHVLAHREAALLEDAPDRGVFFNAPGGSCHVVEH